MRIVAGKHRGRRLQVPKGWAVRPTADRVREALFSILAARRPDPVAGAHVLDLFAGSGALGLEALSRGADGAVLVEKDGPAAAAIADNIARLGEQDRALVLRRDATRLGPADRAFDLVFLDPPYGRGLVTGALGALAEGGWLRPGATLAAEMESGGGLEAPHGFGIELTRTHGAAKIILLTFNR